MTTSLACRSPSDLFCYPHSRVKLHNPASIHYIVPCRLRKGLLNPNVPSDLSLFASCKSTRPSWPIYERTWLLEKVFWENEMLSQAWVCQLYRRNGIASTLTDVPT